MKTIYLLRHEEVDAKYKGRYYGHLDVPLSIRGKVRSLRIAKRLERFNFDKIYSSDLSRTRFILNGLYCNNDIVLTQELREMSWGKHEGLSHEELLELGFEYKNFEQWLSQFDGEGLENFKKRVFAFYMRIICSREKKVLLITHSGVIRVILAYINNRTIEEEFNANLPYGALLKTVARHESSDVLFSSNKITVSYL